MAEAQQELPASLQADPSSHSQTGGPDSTDDLKHGFQRPEMYKDPLAGTVDLYDCHLFLCYKDPQSWPARVEGHESDGLPKFLAAALKSRRNDTPRDIRLTVCEGRDGPEGSDGDVLMFPDMIRYRGLSDHDVDKFVDDVIVHGKEWLPGMTEPLMGSHVFVCAHASRDKRCGVCGPVLITKFQEEIELRGLKDQVFVSPCSHIGGHKYAGNLVIFSSNAQGKVEGHWYGYVTPDDVPVVLDQHISKGEIIDHLWRGQMGLSKEEQRKVHERRVQPNGDKEPLARSKNDKSRDGGCCQEANGFSCCRDEKVETNKGSSGCESEVQNGIEGASCSSKRGVGSLKTRFNTWEKCDTLVALTVVGVLASVAVAYSFRRRSA